MLVSFYCYISYLKIEPLFKIKRYSLFPQSYPLQEPHQNRNSLKYLYSIQTSQKLKITTPDKENQEDFR